MNTAPKQEHTLSPPKILYSFRRCPYAIRARMALQYAKIYPEIIEVNLKDKAPSFLHAAPKGTVPALILDNGTLIDESMDIINYALQQHDPDQWHPKNMQPSLTLIHLNDTHFKQAVDCCKYATRYTTQQYLQAQQKCIQILTQWDALLTKQPFFHGNHFGLADLALLPFIRQCLHLKLYQTHPLLPALRAWLQHNTTSKLFLSVMLPTTKKKISTDEKH
jgi:glutathione S-transferase